MTIELAHTTQIPSRYRRDQGRTGGWGAQDASGSKGAHRPPAGAILICCKFFCDFAIAIFFLLNKIIWLIFVLDN